MIRLFDQATTYDDWLIIPVRLDNGQYGFEVFGDNPESCRYPVEKEFANLDKALEVGKRYVRQKKLEPSQDHPLFALMHLA